MSNRTRRNQTNQDNLSLLLFAFLAIIVICSSCIGVNSKGVVKMHPSPNFNERKYPVSMIILHYTVIPTCEESLARLSDPTNAAGKVSAHYLVDRDGSTYNMVNESKRAWHAGLGSWAGLDDINSRSIGIEIVNVGLTKDGKREPFPDAQIDAIIKLCKDVQSRYTIKYVLGHSDVAPARKQDPGEAFPWKTLANAGVGIWTNEFADSDDDLLKVLAEIGYDTTMPEKAVAAFQRHFYPAGLLVEDGLTKKRAVAVRELMRRHNNLQRDML